MKPLTFKATLKQAPSLLDLTPLVDVVFLLLIFFMFTAEILPLKSLPIQPPTLARKETPTTQQLFILVDNYQMIYVGSHKRIVPLEDLAKTVQEEVETYQTLHKGTEPVLMVSLDKELSYAFFLGLLSALQPLELPIRLTYVS